MSDEKKPEEKAKDVERKPLSRELLEDQIKESERVIAAMQSEAVRLNRDIEQNIGVLNHTRFLLERYDVPSIPRKPEVKKTDLEVK